MLSLQCHLTVRVRSTDFDDESEYVERTTVNGQEVHGACRPGVGGVATGADGCWGRTMPGRILSHPSCESALARQAA